MEQAFRATDAQPDPAAFPRALQLATKTVDDTFSPRAKGDFAKPDCGCVSWRQANSLVYGFYPFWLSPVIPGPTDAGDGTAPNPAGETPPDGKVAAPGPQPIDYVLVERVAFWGSSTAPPTRTSATHPPRPRCATITTGRP